MKGQNQVGRVAAAWICALFVMTSVVPLASAQQGKLRLTLRGHEGDVAAVTFSPDGKVLASGALKSMGPCELDLVAEVKLWDVTTGKELAAFIAHKGDICCLAFSPDGKTLATGGGDDTIKLWDVATRKEKSTWKRSSRGVFAVAFSPNGNVIATGDSRGQIDLLEVSSGKITATLRGADSSIGSLAFDPEGKLLASQSGWRTATSVTEWNLNTGKDKRVFTWEDKSHKFVTLGQGGRSLISGFAKDRMTIWNLDRGTKTIVDHESFAIAAALSPDGKSLAVGCSEPIIELYDLPSAIKAKDEKKD